MGNPVDTGKKTPEGRTIWNDGGKDYSERSTTFAIDDKWYTMPTVSEDGLQYSNDAIIKYVKKYGPIDYLTGEELPEFRYKEDAEEYAVSRSNTRKSFSGGGLSLENVPFFNRPIGAREDDQIIGYMDGDKRFPIYQNATGSQYTINLAEDQRTGMQQFKQETLPVIKDWIKNPTAPSLDQIKEMGSAIASSVYETISIPKDLMTGKKSAMDVTYQDVADIATGTGLASATFKAPEGALRVFGGASAKSTKNLKEAQSYLQDEMKKITRENPTPPSDQFYWANYRTWKKTGWFIDPEDKQWRFEIDDSASKPTLENLPMTTYELLEQTSLGKNSNVETTLSQIFKHDRLYKQYPHLKDMRVTLYNDPKSTTLGFKRSGENAIAVNLHAHRYDFVEKKKFSGGLENDTSQSTLAKTILHEIQHGVQEFEGFTKGANQANIPGELLATKAHKLGSDYNKADAAFNDSISKINEVMTNLPKIPGVKFNIAGYFPKGYNQLDIGYNGDRARKQFQDMVQIHNIPEGSPSYKAVKKEVENIIKAVTDKRSAERLQDRMETEFYMGAGGEIESRLVEGRYLFTKADRAENFPIKERKGMLEYEANEGIIEDASTFTGKQGVDPYQPRRVFEGEGIGQRDIMLDLNWRDFRRPKDSKGKFIPKTKAAAWGKLRSIFKDDQRLNFILNPKNVGKEFDYKGNTYTLKNLKTGEYAKEGLPRDKGVFTLDHLQRNPFSKNASEKYVEIPEIIAERTDGQSVKIGLHHFVKDTQKYADVKIKPDDDSIMGSIKKTFGFAEGGAVDKQMNELFAGSI